jgi:hypothetical protein
MKVAVNIGPCTRGRGRERRQSEEEEMVTIYIYTAEAAQYTNPYSAVFPFHFSILPDSHLPVMGHASVGKQACPCMHGWFRGKGEGNIPPIRPTGTLGPRNSATPSWHKGVQNN